MLNVFSRVRTGVWMLVAIGLATAACGGGDSSTDSAAASSSESRDATDVAADEPTTTSESATTTEPAATVTPSTTTSAPPSTLTGGLVASSVRADVLGYVDYNSKPLESLEEIAVLSDAERDIVIHYYRVGDRYATVFEGMDPDTAACIYMNADGLQADGQYGRLHLDVAALPNGHCHQMSEEISNTETQGVQLCNGQVAFISSFPVDESIDGVDTAIDFVDRRPDGILATGGPGVSASERFVMNDLLPAAKFEQISC